MLCHEVWIKASTEKVYRAFRHSGWDENSDYFGLCDFQWGQVLGKLKQVCESS